MNKKFIILADGTSDLSEDLQKEFDVNLIVGFFTTPDNQEHRQFHNWKENDHDEFYSKLKKNPNGYKTSPPNPEMFVETFKKYIAEGYDILMITMSSTMSGSYNFASKARDEVLAENPKADIRLVDSLRFGAGFGLLVIKASQLRAEGKSLDETAKWIEDNKCRCHQAGWLDDLSFVAKKGRINHAAAFMGTLVGIKPIGDFDYNGMTTVIGKAKGAKKAYNVLLKYIAETIEKPEEQMILIAQSDRLPQAQKYKELIEKTIKPKEVRIVDIFPGTAINIGPGLMAAYYMGKPISKDLAEEKELMTKLLNAPEK